MISNSHLCFSIVVNTSTSDKFHLTSCVMLDQSEESSTFHEKYHFSYGASNLPIHTGYPNVPCTPVLIQPSLPVRSIHDHCKTSKSTMIFIPWLTTGTHFFCYWQPCFWGSPHWNLMAFQAPDRRFQQSPKCGWHAWASVGSWAMPKLSWFRSTQDTVEELLHQIVDGKNPMFITLQSYYLWCFIGTNSSQMMQDFFHAQYMVYNIIKYMVCSSMHSIWYII